MSWTKDIDNFTGMTCIIDLKGCVPRDIDFLRHELRETGLDKIDIIGLLEVWKQERSQWTVNTNPLMYRAYTRKICKLMKYCRTLPKPGMPGFVEPNWEEAKLPICDLRITEHRQECFGMPYSSPPKIFHDVDPCEGQTPDQIQPNIMRDICNFFVSIGIRFDPNIDNETCKLQYE